MDRYYVQEHLTSVAIILFIMFYAGFIYCKPAFLYRKDGSLRAFGLGYANKTVVPIWLLSIILAIMCYFVVLYYIAYPQLWNI
tara:strand:+ start:225 stop:473 length:249 start_codon:yes stop_codon:yes gene_type:complete